MLAAVLEWGAVGGTDLALPTWERGAICLRASIRISASASKRGAC